MINPCVSETELATLLPRQDIGKNNPDEKASRSVVPLDPTCPNQHNCVSHANTQNRLVNTFGVKPPISLADTSSNAGHQTGGTPILRL